MSYNYFDNRTEEMDMLYHTMQFGKKSHQVNKPEQQIHDIIILRARLREILATVKEEQQLMEESRKESVDKLTSQISLVNDKYNQLQKTLQWKQKQNQQLRYQLKRKDQVIGNLVQKTQTLNQQNTTQKQRQAIISEQLLQQNIQLKNMIIAQDLAKSTFQPTSSHGSFESFDPTYCPKDQSEYSTQPLTEYYETCNQDSWDQRDKFIMKYNWAYRHQSKLIPNCKHNMTSNSNFRNAKSHALSQKLQSSFSKSDSPLCNQ